MSNKYITLTNSNSSLSKKYRVLMQNFQPMLMKPGAPSFAIDGTPDVAMGAIRDIRQMVIRVRHTESESGYGTLAELETFFGYNDPSGTPSNVLKLQDHEYPTTSEENIYWIGNFAKIPMTPMIEGTNAWFVVMATFLVIP